MASSLISCRFTSLCPEGFLKRCDVFHETTRQLSRYGKVEWIVVPFLFHSFLRMEMRIVWHNHYDAYAFEERLNADRNITVAGIASCGDGFRLQVSRVHHLTHRAHYFAEECVYPDNICFHIDNDMVWETYILPHGLASEEPDTTVANSPVPSVPDSNNRDSNDWLQAEADDGHYREHEHEHEHDHHHEDIHEKENEKEKERWNTQQAFIKEAQEWYDEQREYEEQMRQELSSAEFRQWKSTQGPRSTKEWRYEMYLRDGVLYC